MNIYEPPKENPSNDLDIADIHPQKITIEIYRAAKKQLRIRLIIVLTCCVLTFVFIDYAIVGGAGFCISLLAIKFTPLVKLMRTAKYHNFPFESDE